MRRFRICLPALTLFVALWSLPVDAQIRRCIAPDGSMIYTDRSCADVGGTERPAPSAISPVFGGKPWARGCSRNLRDLMFEVRAAIDSRDVNRLAGSYHWAGMSNRTGYAIMKRLDAIASRPLVDVSAVQQAPSVSIDADGGMTVRGGVAVRGRQATVAPRPVALRVEQTLSNSITPSRTTFGLRRHMGCWWITL